MKFFADTAVIADIRELAEAGLLDGVTTNPSLIHKSGESFLEVVAEICRVVSGPVSAEAPGADRSASSTDGSRRPTTWPWSWISQTDGCCSPRRARVRQPTATGSVVAS